MSEAEAARIACPTLVAVGARDAVAGDPHRLAAMLPHGQALDIPGRDHNLAVGDKAYKAGVLAFLAARGRRRSLIGDKPPQRLSRDCRVAVISA